MILNDQGDRLTPADGISEQDKELDIEIQQDNKEKSTLKDVEEKTSDDPIKFWRSLRYLLFNFIFTFVFAVLLSSKERTCESSGSYSGDSCYGEMVSGFYVFYYVLAGILLGTATILCFLLVMIYCYWKVMISGYATWSTVLVLFSLVGSAVSLLLSYFLDYCQCPDNAYSESCKANNASNLSNCDPCIPYPCRLTELDAFTLISVVILFVSSGISFFFLAFEIIGKLRLRPERVFAAPIHTDVFLTHDWGTDEKGRNNHERVSLVNKALKKRGLVTWFDEERMDGNVRRKMVEGIENTKCVLVFVTQRYRDKVNGTEERDNCRYEFTYAVERKGPQKMLAVVMEESMMNSRDWSLELGAALGTKLYVSLTEDDVDIFDAKCEEIFIRVRNIIKADT